MSSAIALILLEGDILKDLSIYMTALLCILPRIFSGYDRDAHL